MGFACDEDDDDIEMSPVKEANPWGKNAKVKEMQELNEQLGVTIDRYGGSSPQIVRGITRSDIGLEDTSEFEEPVLKRLSSNWVEGDADFPATKPVMMGK